MPRSRAVRPRRSQDPPWSQTPDSIESLYATAVARAILGVACAVAAAGGSFGRRRLVNHLRGNQLPPPAPEGGEPAPGFALLESHRAGWIEEAVDRLVEEGYLAPSVVAGRARFAVTAQGARIAGGSGSLPPGFLPARPRLGAHPEIEDRLRAARRELAAREGRAAYLVFPNGVLAELAAARPANLGDLARVRGFGEARVRKYGRRILKALGG